MTTFNIPRGSINAVRLKPYLSVDKAHNAQMVLSKRIISKDHLPEMITSIAGIDVAYVDGLSIAVAAVLDYGDLKLKEVQTTISETLFPYIPTLLSFRELPPAMQCIHKLQTRPDVFLVDGHGYAHPYRCGFACHLGLVLKKPTIGVAKSILVGKVDRDLNEEISLLRHSGETIGAEIRSESHSKPVYVSVGNMVSLRTAVRIVKHCTTKGRIPAPLLLAHRIANAAKRKINMLAQRKETSE
jgi:deoxyribonuclease V